jgi:Isochorismatase family
MPELSHIYPWNTALLVMDYQVDALTKFMTAAQSADAIACMPDLIAMARDASMMVIHVVVAFRPGHPEVSPRGAGFSAVKANGMLAAGNGGAAIHPAAAAREGEPILPLRSGRGAAPAATCDRTLLAPVVPQESHAFSPETLPTLRQEGEAQEDSSGSTCTLCAGGTVVKEKRKDGTRVPGDISFKGDRRGERHGRVDAGAYEVIGTAEARTLQAG